MAARLEDVLPDLQRIAAQGDVVTQIGQLLWQAGWRQADLQRELARLPVLPDQLLLQLVNDFRDRERGLPHDDSAGRAWMDALSYFVRQKAYERRRRNAAPKKAKRRTS